ncbi:hypothetical protein CHH69_18760, partial [Terribacillus saccharophilus]|uniref:hypothetical protein n=1 Tax=Terribacillus saccharophilus TaxID=361277 RepID=UPI000BC61804
QAVIKLYEETILPDIKAFKDLDLITQFTTRLLRGQKIIKADRFIGLLNNIYLRESSESLAFRTDKSRSVKYLFRVIGEKE